MRIAWVCNKPPQSVVKAAGIDGGNFGGWLDSTAADLLSMPGNELMVLFLGDGQVEGVDGNLAYASFAGGSGRDEVSWAAGGVRSGRRARLGY